MTDRTWLGIDVGTQSVRVLAVDDGGHLVGYGFSALTSFRSRERHEQNPEHWWHAVVKAASMALTGVDTEAIGALAVAATSGTVLLADPAGHPYTYALMYDDERATDEARLVSEVGAPVWEVLGYRRMPPSWALPKLIWLLREHRELATQNVRLCHQADLITTRLVGHPVATDTSHALKSGYHLVEDRWPIEVFDRLGVPGHVLPDVVRPGTILGIVGAEAASATGIPADTPVVAGMTDGCAAQLGAGGLEIGSWNSVLGTTLVLKGVSAKLIRDPKGLVYCHRGVGETWLPGAASNSGAGVISRRFANTDIDELTARTAELPIGPIAYPLASSGERFPFRAPQADPFVLGDVSSDAAMFGALLLGVACVERLCLDYLARLGAPIEGPLNFTGGGARNRYWTQLRVDLLGRPARLLTQPEPALGMAVLAATRAGRSLVEVASTMVRVGTELTPNPARAPMLLQRYNDFLDALTARGWLDATTAAYARTRGQP